MSRAASYRARSRLIEPQPARRRPGPVGPMPDPGLVLRIRAVLVNSSFHGKGYRKVWARLRHGGVRTSKERVRRLMRTRDLAPARAGRTPRGPRAHDGTIIPEGADQMWGTDMTNAVTPREGQVAVFNAIDHFTAECFGIHAAKRGTRFEALRPVRQGVRAHFGAIGRAVAAGLSLRHDHGTQYMSHDFQKESR
jgi:hypothetical protein